MEIERKFLISPQVEILSHLGEYRCRRIEQGYLNTNPVVRVRQDEDSYYLTYKGAGLKVREEYNLPLTKEAYAHLLKKADGMIITKDRYEIPYESYVIELDVFHGDYEGFLMAEVEFASEAECDAFLPPEWFGEDVTGKKEYSNSFMSENKLRK
ncbi:MAG: CYTH domain-containing protein [Lachnospiraceae bacterium]|nr:CYTH domain-containing protein [Lachnospiraceae bacterium]